MNNFKAFRTFQLFSKAFKNGSRLLQAPPTSSRFSTSEKVKKFTFFKVESWKGLKWNRIVLISILPVIPISCFLLDKASDTILAALLIVHMHQ